jgi:hypothetical protein
MSPVHDNNDDEKIAKFEAIYLLAKGHATILFDMFGNVRMWTVFNM